MPGFLRAAALATAATLCACSHPAVTDARHGHAPLSVTDATAPARIPLRLRVVAVEVSDTQGRWSPMGIELGGLDAGSALERMQGAGTRTALGEAADLDMEPGVARTADVAWTPGALSGFSTGRAGVEVSVRRMARGATMLVVSGMDDEFGTSVPSRTEAAIPAGGTVGVELGVRRTHGSGGGLEHLVLLATPGTGAAADGVPSSR